MPRAPSRLPVLVSILALVVFVQFAFPFLAAHHVFDTSAVVKQEQFTVSVDIEHKTIAGGSDLSPFLIDRAGLIAAALQASGDAMNTLAVAAAESPLYQAVAPAEAPIAVVIYPGYRREQVANIFSTALHWDSAAKKVFVQSDEGTYYPSTYVVGSRDTASAIQALIEDRFADRVLSRYGTTTRERVPLETALTIASLIEREAGDNSDMRTISGIIWNRIFAGMPLQLDATLQYARGTSKNGWWPIPRSRDKYVASVYNTYTTVGLPPTPIASPSVAAIAAALNPVNTACLFYFHDSHGGFHCSATYAEHVKALKKYYGRGK